MTMKSPKFLMTAASLFFCLNPLFAGAATKSTTVTDQLLALLLEKNLPAPMYEQASNPWPGGDYSLEVHKMGRPEVTSSATNIHVKIPLKVLIAGKINSDLLQIKMTCDSTFTTVGEILLTPEKSGVVSTLASVITLPIPPVMADCDGVKVPVDQYLQTVVTQNKKQWETKLDTEIRSWLLGDGNAAKPASAQKKSSLGEPEPAKK